MEDIEETVRDEFQEEGLNDKKLLEAKVEKKRLKKILKEEKF